jgi:uncharacterized protein YyaL (SSP411 family)
LLDLHYGDSERGGYFLTPADAPDLIVRLRNALDHATPSGNGMMVELLSCLHALTGKPIYRDLADRQIGAFGGEAVRNSIPLAAFLSGMDFYLNGVQIVIRAGCGTDALQRAAWDCCLPNRILSVLAPGEEIPAGHPAFGKTNIGDRATAYVCVGQVCSLPVIDPDNLRGLLSGRGGTFDISRGA